MSWLSDVFKPVSDVFSGVGDFVKENSSWIKPIAQIGGTYYGNKIKTDAANAYAKYQEDLNRQNYNDTMAYRDWAYRQMTGEEGGGGGYSGGGGGGGGGGGRSRKLLEQIRQARLDAIQAALDIYKPYKEASALIVPKMADVYSKGVENMGSLYANMVTPEYLQSMNTFPDVMSASIELPDYLKKVRTQG